LFYQDLKVDQDRWIKTNKAAGNIFIHVRKFSSDHPNPHSDFLRVISMLKTLEHIWIIAEC